MNSPLTHPTALATPAGEDMTLANARLVLPDRVMTGALTVDDGMIADISEGDRMPTGAIDCGGDYVLPGLIELHTDNLERHIEPRPRVDWPHLPALVAHDSELASTGITTVFDALRVGSIHNAKARYAPYARQLADELLQARATGCFKISHFLHLRAEICSETLPQEMAAFGADDRVGIVSLMDHTPGQRQFRDLSALRTYLTRKRPMTDAEFADHVATRRELQERLGTRHEATAVAEAARYGAVLASHDDTTSAQVAASARNGVTFAEFPTTLEAAEACRARGISIMMGAPNIVRGKSHSGNVPAPDLARAGLLDLLSSDYVPSALLLAAFHLAALWDDVPRAVACVTRTPAQVTGIADRGSLVPGRRGDLLRVRMVGDHPLVSGVWCLGRKVA
jgi:alpha-D-ribose 1-methylphosphonate 5-triphosphate diphosphatase